MTQNKSVFDSFTNLYSLSKTLRFELKPVGKTLEHLKKAQEYDPVIQTFMKDQEIEDAYQSLKPVLDKIHEDFITQSLVSPQAKSIDFSPYILAYNKKDATKQTELDKIEKDLRSKFDACFDEAADMLKVRAGKDVKGKPVLKESGYSVLTEAGILKYIQNTGDSYTDILKIDELTKALNKFKGFFTYFTGFNQNRENYYLTKDEKATAVATRIVHENLPKFCDNSIFFETRKVEYLSAYDLLSKLGRSLVKKDGTSLLPIISDIFQIAHFNSCLSQAEIELYNDTISNANSLINLYNQANSDKGDFKKLPSFKTLFKQIGCGRRDALFFTITHDRNDNDRVNKDASTISVEDVLGFAKKAGLKYFTGASDDGLVNTVSELVEYLLSLDTYVGVYWSKAAINSISNMYFANFHDVRDRLKVAKIFQKGTDESGETVKIPEVVELQGVFEVLDGSKDWQSSLFKSSVLSDTQKQQIIYSSSTPSRALIKMILNDVVFHANSFINQTNSILALKEYKSESSKESIKMWLEDALNVNQILKYFLVRENKVKGSPLDPILSEALKTLLYAPDAPWFTWYDGLRNYLTKKPQDNIRENKLKLNFENSSLAGGWDLNKEPDNYCVIFQNSDLKQFLGVIAKNDKIRGYNKIFDRTKDNALFQVNEHGELWKKMEYKLLPGPNKMLPKCLLPKSDPGKYGADEEILKIYQSGSFKKSEPCFSIHDLSKMINFYKSALLKYEDWKCFDFLFRPTEEYVDISQFYLDVEMQGYKLNLTDINGLHLNQLVDQGKIYLFEIKNQDSNMNKSLGHSNNLHTMYWRSAFSDFVNRPKLNGNAEVFYRKALDQADLSIKTVGGKNIIQNFRFSKEKFLFHVPITLNFCLKNDRVNHTVNSILPASPNIHFLGIDRGEKHLAYYSLVDQDGKLVDQGSLNMPFIDRNGDVRCVKKDKYFYDSESKTWCTKVVDCKDYNDLLDAMASNRDMARKNWKTIGTIKELKNGYVSLVVRKIADLAVASDRPAFIALEDLNTGFKRGRQKIEKSVYQKLELALAKKLNFLVNKSAIEGEVGSVTRALQLTPPVANYEDIEGRKQVGIMLYTRANYTSQTDPVTGWRKTIYLKPGSEDAIKIQIVNSFSDISFNGRDYCFGYSDAVGTYWRIYSGKDGKALDRYRGSRTADKNIWQIEKIDVVQSLDTIFKNFDKSKSLLEQIRNDVRLTKIDQKHTAWESLRFNIELIQQIRNGDGAEESPNDNFLLSPARDIDDIHFDSRDKKLGLPVDADANGAYNIARKGLIMQAHITTWQAKGEPKYAAKSSDLSLFVSDEEWDLYLTKRNEWERKLSIFSSRKAMESIQKDKKAKGTT